MNIEDIVKVLASSSNPFTLDDIVDSVEEERITLDRQSQKNSVSMKLSRLKKQGYVRRGWNKYGEVCWKLTEQGKEMKFRVTEEWE